VPAVGAYRSNIDVPRDRSKMLHCITSQIGHAGPSCAFCCELIVASAGDDLMVWCEEKQINCLFGLGKSG
jgi:hypothetical protein